MGEHDPDAKHDARGGTDAIDRDRVAYEPNPGKHGRWLAAAIGLLGAWLVVQAIAFDLAASQFWNAVLVGVLAFGFGAYSAAKTRDRRRSADARATATFDRRGH
ncbi:hypothetical protein RBH26_02855 [Natronolimnohabitans sp. A-GB9]|uniref:hypothetical protein n=1 Tax=Natronolimnohabitans sp. A-GB9 TaxID=3069757 RepID=UPI0027B40D0F|nr:hypothetical protein [Natronolimnohabitans sp. A-GB9]MDQ2049416.1 hypothetical protein [Natronolimnohabitans sp. A-GB9]